MLKRWDRFEASEPWVDSAFTNNAAERALRVGFASEKKIVALRSAAPERGEQAALSTWTRKTLASSPPSAARCRPRQWLKPAPRASRPSTGFRQAQSSPRGIIPAWQVRHCRSVERRHANSAAAVAASGRACLPLADAGYALNRPGSWLAGGARRYRRAPGNRPGAMDAKAAVRGRSPHCALARRRGLELRRLTSLAKAGLACRARELASTAEGGRNNSLFGLRLGARQIRVHGEASSRCAGSDGSPRARPTG